MTSASDDELFASLGSSLMRDLLSDMDNNPTSSNHTTNDDDATNTMLNTLSILEEELDKTITNTDPTTTAKNTQSTSSSSVTSPPPPGMRPPGLSNHKQSAAAMVVHHASSVNTTTPKQPPRNSKTTPLMGDDAWGQALNQFSALALTEDFLKADSARKEQTTHKQIPEEDAIGAELVDRLLFTEEEEYDVQAEVTLPIGGGDGGVTGNGMAAYFPGVAMGGGGGGGGPPPPHGGVAICGVDSNGGGPPPPPGGRGDGRVNPGGGSSRGASPAMERMPPPPSLGGGRPPPQMMPHSQQQQMQQGQVPMGRPNPMGVPMPNPHMIAMMQAQAQAQAHQNAMMSNSPHRPLPPGVGMPHHPHGPHPHMVMASPHHPGNMHPQMVGHGPPFPSPGNNRMSPMPNMPPQQQQGHPQLGVHPAHMLLPPPKQLNMMQMQPPPPQSNNNNPNNNNNNNNNQNRPSETPEPQKTFNATSSDFPALGNTQPQTKKELQEERRIASTKVAEPPPPSKKSTTTPSPNNPQAAGPPPPQPPQRIKFQNPSPTAPPIPAALITSKAMTPRDLCHVLHSMMRPLLALDPYNADYYRWSYDDRKSRNLLFLGGGAGDIVLPNTNRLPNGAVAGGRIDLPNPVWKETKVKAREIDETFRENVEKRAADWSKEKHILGKIAKNNVKRPRAMLATSTLSTALLLGEEGKVGEEEASEEDKQRAYLWASRLASDKGYLAYLNLVELRRLLQSRPGEAALIGSATDADGPIGSRREELLIDVEENVGKLNGAFGVKNRKQEDGTTIIEVDEVVLSRTLSLPKGRMLLSRVIDEGILPHPSACHVLPAAIQIILKSCVTTMNLDVSVAPPPGEDRLLRSLTGLVRTVRPSIDPPNVMRCLSNVNCSKKEIGETQLSIRDILTGKRTLMELLHAVLSLGGDVCVGGALEKDWKAKEADFLGMLSGA